MVQACNSAEVTPSKARLFVELLDTLGIKQQTAWRAHGTAELCVRGLRMSEGVMTSLETLVELRIRLEFFELSRAPTGGTAKGVRIKGYL